MPLYVSNLECRIHDFMSLTPYFQPPVGVKQSESRIITPCYLFLALYSRFSVLSCPGKTCSPMAIIEQWYSRKSTAPETHTENSDTKDAFGRFFYVEELSIVWNVGLPTWKYPKNLGSSKVASPGFYNDPKTMIILVDVTAQPLIRQFQGIRLVQTLNRLFYMLVDLLYVFHLCISCRLHLAWSREHALWTPHQWACVIFFDESRFSLQSDSYRTFIWRAPGTRFHQENSNERHHFDSAGLLVCGEGELLWVPDLTCMLKLEPRQTK
ncbi:transposable element Tcb1 transposase [Trichonephila clavipes]|uniref:Transposable element Tcb1 transposase n=1 Tax=Trichonephila clavipes TaxID=2585209 RepID=A0A8X6VUX6_TRICX|nr:transposable element Tcb1 transposase [Trichonephila clavipes]